MRTFEYRLYPKKEQSRLFMQCLIKSRILYNEMLSTVTAFRYDANRGMLETLQTIPTIAKEDEKNSTAEIVVHPSGKFVYCSNRGHNSIAIFSFDAKTGMLTPVGHQNYLIKTPRNFAIDPTGKYLLAASQTSGKVIVFGINPTSGELTPTGSVIDVPSPVCIRTMPAPLKN